MALSAGDRLYVPGSAVGSAEEDAVIVVADGGITTDGTGWLAECSV